MGKGLAETPRKNEYTFPYSVFIDEDHAGGARERTDVIDLDPNIKDPNMRQKLGRDGGKVYLSYPEGVKKKR